MSEDNCYVLTIERDLYFVGFQHLGNQIFYDDLLYEIIATSLIVVENHNNDEYLKTFQRVFAKHNILFDDNVYKQWCKESRDTVLQLVKVGVQTFLESSPSAKTKGFSLWCTMYDNDYILQSPG